MAKADGLLNGITGYGDQDESIIWMTLAVVSPGKLYVCVWGGPPVLLEHDPLHMNKYISAVHPIYTNWSGVISHRKDPATTPSHESKNDVDD